MQPMETRYEPVPAPPKTIRYCKVCRRETPHEILAGSGVVAKVCIPCLEQTERYELDRD